MHDAETWSLARPLLLSLGAFLTLLSVGWATLRKREEGRLLWVPYIFLTAAGSLWFLFVTDDAVSRRYAVATSLALLVSALIHLIVTLFLSRSFSRQREIRFPPLLRNVVLGFSYFAILLLCLKMLNRDFSLTPLLVTSGVLSLILGLALQDILGNFLAGVVLTVERPFQIDDWIEVEEHAGKVVGVTWRVTRLLTRDNDYLIIPNKQIADAVLVNRNFPTAQHMVRIQIGLPYATIPGVAEDALLEAASRVEDVLRVPAPKVFMREFADSAITYELGFWIDTPDISYAVASRVRQEIFHALNRHDISVPYPIREVHAYPGPSPDPALQHGSRFRLVVTGGPRKGLVFPVEGEACVLGRAAECELELLDASISKRHAEFKLDDGRYHLTDLGSVHGTLVNGEAAEGQPLRSGDEIKLGASVLRFEEIVAT